MSSHRLQDVFPEFALELEELLRSSKEPELAEQVSELQITRRCDCEDDFRGSFFTIFEPSKRPWADAHCLEIEPTTGMIILHVVSGRIAHIEALYRDDVRDRIRGLFS